MNVISTLLAICVGAAIGLGLLVLDDLRWEARDRVPRCTTCGEQHPRHATHR
ncbi:hypothetical protein ABZ858_00405 [Streptomyces sp. NPDC047017]|uniref:hypothetical protein n=1 Tax=Streptomyces sp. NPDC047017 TaxID=3155024 RepID=UPI0033E2FF9A